MDEFRAPRTWHIEERYGYFYATNQYGGFSRYNTEAGARWAISQDVERYGDTWQQLEAVR